LDFSRFYQEISVTIWNPNFQKSWESNLRYKIFWTTCGPLLNQQSLPSLMKIFRLKVIWYSFATHLMKERITILKYFPFYYSQKVPPVFVTKRWKIGNRQKFSSAITNSRVDFQNFPFFYFHIFFRLNWLMNHLKVYLFSPTESHEIKINLRKTQKNHKMKSQPSWYLEKILDEEIWE
jgi:hypothetical protein